MATHEGADQALHRDVGATRRERAWAGRWLVRLAVAILALVVVVLAAGYYYEKISELRDARHYPVPGTMVFVNGHRMHLLCKAQGTPAVVIETASGSGFVFWRVQDEVAKFTRVCTYDRPGYAWSEPAPSRTMEQRVEELHQLLTNASVAPPYVVVGHSYGGDLMQIFASTYPREVSGAVLVDSGEYEISLTPAFQKLTEAEFSRLRWMAMKARVGIVRFELRNNNPDLAAAFATPRYFIENADEMRSLLSVSDEMQALGRSESLGNLPLLLIRHGNLQTDFLPLPGLSREQIEAQWMQAQERLLHLSSNAEMVVAEKSGHNIEIDQPEIVVDGVRRVVLAARENVPVASVK